MLVKTLLNKVQKYRCFVYKKCQLVEDTNGRTRLEVKVEARANSRPVCSGCGESRPGYDHLKERRFEFVPLWGIAVFFLYVMRRVNCQDCGVVVQRVPWADGKHQLTTTYSWFLARWAKRLSWKEVAEAFSTTWDKVFSSVSMAVVGPYASRFVRCHSHRQNRQALQASALGWS